MAPAQSSWMALPHVAGPFKKTFRDYEQPWHIVKFSGVKDEILKLEPEIFDTPGNEQVRVSPRKIRQCP